MNPKLNNVEKALLRILLYFDIFHYPITGEQAYLYCSLKDISLSRVRSCLRSQKMKIYLQEKDGFYFLKGKSTTVNQRQQETRNAGEMWKIVAQIINYLKFVPFVRAVFVSGDLGKGVSKSYSDIDFLIVSAAKRVYFCKFFLAIFRRMKCFKHRELPCFNYLISESSPEIPEKNMFTAVEMATLVPVYNRGLCHRFLLANEWVADWIPRYMTAFPEESGQTIRYPRLQRLLEFPFQNRLADHVEKKLLKFWHIQWSRKYRNDPRRKKLLLGGLQAEYSKSHGNDSARLILWAYHQRLEKYHLTATTEQSEKKPKI